MQGFQEITTAELYNRIKAGEKINLIDIREDTEVAQGMIANARHIKKDELAEHLNELNQEETYYIICRTGARSLWASQLLADFNFQAVNVKGGISEWTGELVMK